MNILITGGTGFVGKHLSAYYHEKFGDHAKVVVSSRNQTTPNTLHLDLLNYEKSREVLLKNPFDKIFHLAAQSSVGLSHQDPYGTIQQNLSITLNLFRILEEAKIQPKIVVASSCEIYEAILSPISEDSPRQARNPYGLSKSMIDDLALFSAHSRNLNIALLRLFNHTGPGQSDNFVLASFSKQLAEIKLGLRDSTIHVGNLEAERDFTDVRDVCMAYDLASDTREPGTVYNVCSGKAHKIKDLLDKLIILSGQKVSIQQDPDRLRPSDIPIFSGDHSKIKRELGWTPHIPIEKTLEDMYRWWLKQLNI